MVLTEKRIKKSSTMKISEWFILFLASNFSFTLGANILALLTIPSPSHHIWISPLLVALANRGHNVTVVSPQAQSKPVVNLTDLAAPGTYEEIRKIFDFTSSSEASTFESLRNSFLFTIEGCTHILHSSSFNKLMNYPPDVTFDLVIIEFSGCECLLGAVTKFGNPPIIAVNGYMVPNWLMGKIGTPNYPSYMPYILSTNTDHMTFMERLKNVFYNIHGYFLYHNLYLPQMNELAREFYDPQIQPVEDILKRISAVMANIHMSFDFAWPMTPNLIPVAGIHIEEPQPLRNEFQKFLDEAEHGAIYFSLGSNVRSDSLPPEKRQSILDAFAEIPQRVLWKYESQLSDLPHNVKINDWFPQNSILAHPNVKLFITHAGLLSSHEAIYREVPVIGIPFLVEQHANIRRIEHHRAGIKLAFHDLTKKSLVKAIQTVTNNPSFRENMQVLSQRFRDNPQTPLARAVFWTEYIIRYQGAAHMQSASLDLNIVQYLLLDIVLVITLPLLVLLLVICYLCREDRRTNKKAKRK